MKLYASALRRRRNNLISNVGTATAADEASTIGVLVRAFSADPVAQWLWHDPQQYYIHFPSFVRAFAGKAFTHGSAYYVNGFAATALWLPPNVHPNEEELISVVQRTVSKQIQKDFFRVFELMNAYHPSEPHWYLPLMGVHPLQQGKGFGSALLQHTLIQCDRDSKFVYLESSNPRNIPLYKRHDFELLGKIQAGTSPPILPMLRRPR